MLTLLFSLSYLSLFFSQVPAFVLPPPRGPPPLESVASRGTSRQINAFVDAHNDIRKLHYAEPLAWSKELAAKAEYFGDRCPKEHSGGSLYHRTYGENIAAGTGKFSIVNALESFTNDKSEHKLYPSIHFIDAFQVNTIL